MDDCNIVYCDFDGTITKNDCVNKFLSQYADNKWLDIEYQWLEGKIGSKECIKKQMGLIKNISHNELKDFIYSIEIDEYFLDFYNYLNEQNKKLVILSDGFDLFIKETLNIYNISDIKYYANKLLYKNNKFSLLFENSDKNCRTKAGMCKCSKILEEKFIYIGDGLSDSCVADKASLLFAKNKLQRFCDENNINYISFKTFNDILNYFREKGELNAKHNYINI
jgi:2,3-diketo-5-methylthio-1-phosphopentane phosphatase